MKALKFTDKLHLVTDAPVPRREGETLVQVLYAGICSTDLEITRGYAGFHGILGHEFVGRVVESPRKELIGRRVVGEINVGCGTCALCSAGDSRHCHTRSVLGIKDRDGAFAEYLSLPDTNLIEVPDVIDDKQAVFVEPLAAALHVVDHVEVTGSSQVAVIGDGKLGQLIVRALKHAGCQLTNIGKHQEKLERSMAIGANALDISQAPLLAGSFDIVLEATGSPAGLSVAFDLVRPQGVVVLKSTHHDLTPMDLSRAVVDEITLIGSRCGRFAPAVELLARHSINLSGLITGELPLEQGVEAFELARSSESLKVLLRMS